MVKPVCGELHQVLEELTTSEGIEAGDRLVEQEELRALADGEREGQLRSLAARQRPGLLLPVQPEPGDALLGHEGFSLAPISRWSAMLSER